MSFNYGCPTKLGTIYISQDPSDQEIDIIQDFEQGMFNSTVY